MLTFILMTATGMRLREAQSVTLFSKDEVSYTRLTGIAMSGGNSGLQAEAARFRAQPSLFEQPSPVRAGYLFGMAAILRLTDGRDVRDLATVSALLDGVSLCLLGVLAWQWLGPWRSLAAMLLYGVSPPAIAMARRAWQESAVACFGLLMIWMALQCVERRKRGWAVGLGTLAALSFTIKETAFLEACVVLVLAAVTLARQQRWKQSAWVGGSFAVVLGICWVWTGFLLGGIGEVAHFLIENARVSASSLYATQAESGGVMDWLAMLWKADPFLITLGGLGAVLTAATWKRGRTQNRLLVWSMAIAAVFLVLPTLSVNRLNLRFAAPAFAPLCLLGAEALFAIDGLLQASLPRHRRIARAAIVVYLAVIGIVGVRQYQVKFAARDMIDLSAAMVLMPDAPGQGEGASR